MPIRNIVPIDATQLENRENNKILDWVWEGYLRPKSISLLVSEWKIGKTTLLTGLLQKLGTGEPFLERKVRKGKVLVITEESEEQWMERQLVQPLGKHVRLLSQPYEGNPTLDDWQCILDQARAMQDANELDLLVVDTMTANLPLYTESDVGAMIAALRPARELANLGVAILFLHHPRREKSNEGNTSRGTGSLLGYVDFILELKRVGPVQAHSNLRVLSVRSRAAQQQTQQTYEWNLSNGQFHVVPNFEMKEYELVWPEIESILRDHPRGLSVKEMVSLLDRSERPIRSDTLYQWMNRALRANRLARLGLGTRNKPYVYKLPTNDKPSHEFDDLPPLPELLRMKSVR